MDVWAILGISPTKEPRKIKRAYSKRIATCHPEDDPQGFQALQQAYELALQYAKGDLDLDDLEELDDIETSFQFAAQLEKELQEDEGEQEADADVLAAYGEGSEDAAAPQAQSVEKPSASIADEGEEPDAPDAQPLQSINWRAQRDVFAGGFVPQADDARNRKRGAARPNEGPAVTFTGLEDTRQETAARMVARRERRADAGEEAAETPSFIKDFLQDETAKERKRLEKMEFHLEELEELIESDGDLVSFFNLGIYARYRDVEGFEERLAAMLEDYVQQMNVIEMAELEEAIGHDDEDGGPLAILFNSRYEATSPLSFVKGIISFIKKA